MDQENFLQQNFAARIGGSSFGKDTKIYKFEKIKRSRKRPRTGRTGPTRTTAARNSRPQRRVT